MSCVSAAKHTGFLRLVLIMLTALSLMAFGCASQEQEEPEEAVVQEEVEVVPEPEPEPEPEPVRNSIPQTCFSDRLESKYDVYDMEGNQVEPAIEGVTFVGPFSGGYVLGWWDTEEYDEEFKTAYDQKRHLGLFDSTGNLAFELTDALTSAGVDSFFYSVGCSDALRFEDDRLVVPISSGDRDSNQAFVFDSNGALVFSLTNVSAGSDQMVYHDGVLVVYSKDNKTYCIYDAQGNLLAQRDGGFTELTSCGNGYYVYGAGYLSFFSYDGTEVLNPEALNGDGIINAAATEYQPGIGSLAYIEAVKENPHEGGNGLKLSGLYSLENGNWVFPLSEGFRPGTASKLCLGHEGALSISFESDNQEMPSSQAEAAEQVGPFAKLVNTQGQTVFDESFIADDLSFKFINSYKYLHDGYWLIDGFSYDTSSKVVIYIEDGAYKGFAELNNVPLDTLDD